MNGDIPSLVGKTLQGDQAAFTSLVTAHQNAVFALAYEQTRNGADAEEIAQESFFRAYRDLRKLRQADRFASWLYGITLNVCRERVRKRRFEVPFRGAPEPAAPSTEREARTDRLLALVATLPEESRVPLTLHYLGRAKYAEIGRILGITEEAARVRVHRARAQLRRMLRETP